MVEGVLDVSRHLMQHGGHPMLQLVTARFFDAMGALAAALQHAAVSTEFGSQCPVKEECLMLGMRIKQAWMPDWQ